MPKKKPIAKRLDKLFDNIKQEDPSAKPLKKDRVSDNAPVEKKKFPVDAKQPVKTRARTAETVQSITQKDSALALAFRTGPNNWSTLQVQGSSENDRWSEEDQLLIKQVTDQLELALENARLFQDAQRRANEMTALADVGREISATLQVEIVLTRMAEYAKELLQAETSAIYLPGTNNDTWNAVSVVGIDAEEIKNDPIQTGRGILGNIAITKEGRIVNNASQTSDAINVAGTEPGAFEHIMSVPIMSLDRVTGLMAVWRTGEGLEFSPTELNFLTNLGQQASIAIENARLFQNVNESQGQLSEALRIARIGYFEINLVTQEIALTNELLSLLNTSAEKEGGYQFPLDQILQKFVLEDDISIATEAVQNAIAQASNRSELTSEVRYKTNDGRIIWVSSTYKVEQDNKGNPVKVVGSSQDITERKTNELTQAAITQISESALTAETMEELFKTTHDSIQPVLPAKNFFVALFDRETSMINFPYHVDEQDDDWEPRKIGRGLTAYVIRSGRPSVSSPISFLR